MNEGLEDYSPRRDGFVMPCKGAYTITRLGCKGLADQVVHDLNPFVFVQKVAADFRE